MTVIVYTKGREKYAFLFREGQGDKIVRSIARMAADPELSLTWADAAVLAQRIRSAQCQP